MAHGRIIECVKCHVEKMHHAHGMCRWCYNRSHYRKDGEVLRSAPPSVWGRARLRELGRLYSTGLPLSAIATIMGVTKNTISGACYRNGLSRKEYEGPTLMKRLAAYHRKMDALPDAKPFKYGMTFDGIPFG